MISNRHDLIYGVKPQLTPLQRSLAILYELAIF